jgi:hypothetical protein
MRVDVNHGGMRATCRSRALSLWILAAVLGVALIAGCGSTSGPETARTMRPDHGEMRLTDGPFLDPARSIASVDVISCADRQQAVELAAAHPLARRHAIEVRPFYSE